MEGIGRHREDESEGLIGRCSGDRVVKVSLSHETRVAWFPLPFYLFLFELGFSFLVPCCFAFSLARFLFRFLFLIRSPSLFPSSCVVRVSGLVYISFRPDADYIFGLVSCRLIHIRRLANRIAGYSECGPTCYAATNYATPTNHKLNTHNSDLQHDSHLLPFSANRSSPSYPVLRFFSR